MPEPTAYVDQLAAELRTRRPDVLRAAEDELQRLRTVLGTVARFINNPQYDHHARTALAHDLQLPAPERTK
jgi:hypothetical protein